MQTPVEILFQQDKSAQAAKATTAAANIIPFQSCASPSKPLTTTISCVQLAVAGGVGLDCCVTTSIGVVAVVVFFTHKPQREGRRSQHLA